jgi:hypothetical protein
MFIEVTTYLKENTPLASLILVGGVVLGLFLVGPYEGVRSIFYIFYWSGTGVYELVYGLLLLFLTICLIVINLKVEFPFVKDLAYVIAAILGISLFCKIGLAFISYVMYGQLGAYLGGAPILTILLVMGLVLVRYDSALLKPNLWKVLSGELVGSFLLALIIAGSVYG